MKALFLCVVGSFVGLILGSAFPEPSRALEPSFDRWDYWMRRPLADTRSTPGCLRPLDQVPFSSDGAAAAAAEGAAQGSGRRLVFLPLELAAGRSDAARSVALPEERGVRIRRPVWLEGEGGARWNLGDDLRLQSTGVLSLREGELPAGRFSEASIALIRDRHSFVLGRSPIRWGCGIQGSILLGLTAPARPNLRWRTSRALAVPASLGTWSGEAFLAILDDEHRRIANPLMLGHRFSWQVARWIEITQTRTVMFGGEGRTRRLSPRGAWRILTGGDSGHPGAPPYDSDQKASWEIRLLLPCPSALGLDGLEAFYEYAGDDLIDFPVPSLVARQFGASASLHGWTLRAERLNTTNPTARWYDHDAVYGPSSYSYRGFPLGLSHGGQAISAWVGIWTPDAPLQLRGSVAWQEFGEDPPSREERAAGTLAARWRPNEKLAIEVAYQGSTRRGEFRDPRAPALLRSQVDLRLTCRPSR